MLLVRGTLNVQNEKNMNVHTRGPHQYKSMYKNLFSSNLLTLLKNDVKGFVTCDTLRLQVSDREEQSQSYKYLANYFVRNKQYDEAYNYAQKCTEYPEV